MSSPILDRFPCHSNENTSNSNENNRNSNSNSSSSSGSSSSNCCYNSKNITVRPAVFPDIARIAWVAINSLPDDPTFDYLWSHRHEYPDDNYFFWLQTLKGHLFNPRFTLLVATLNTPTPPPSPAVTTTTSSSCEKSGYRAAAAQPPVKQLETIIAFGLWERNGRSRAARKRYRERNTCYNRLHRVLTRVETWALNRQHQRRDVNPAHLSAFSAVMDAVHKEYWTDLYPENFHLDLLCTLPQYRRLGAGTALTRWGIDAAASEGAIVAVESSPMGLPLYEGLGFRIIRKRIVKVDDEEETLLVRIMVCIPNRDAAAGAAGAMPR